jgi:hypothetical protein
LRFLLTRTRRCQTRSRVRYWKRWSRVNSMDYLNEGKLGPLRFSVRLSIRPLVQASIWWGVRRYILFLMQFQTIRPLHGWQE